MVLPMCTTFITYLIRCQYGTDDAVNSVNDLYLLGTLQSQVGIQHGKFFRPSRESTLFEPILQSVQK